MDKLPICVGTDPKKEDCFNIKILTFTLKPTPDLEKLSCIAVKSSLAEDGSCYNNLAGEKSSNPVNIDDDESIDAILEEINRECATIRLLRLLKYFTLLHD